MTEPSDTCDSPDMSAPERQRLVEEHAPMVRQIAHGMLKELPHSVREDDLVQDGLLGLLDAILRANKAMTAQQFRSFAAQRIRGAVLDGLRAADWGSRRVRRAMRNIEITTQQLGHQLGRAPSESEVAAALGIPLASYQHTLQQAHGYFLISLDDLDGWEENSNYLDQCVSSNADPLVVLQRADFQKALAAALAALPAQEKEVVSLYYETERTMRQIGETLALSEGRVSQIHAQAIARLRAAVLGGAEKLPLLAPRRKPREPATA